MVCPQGSSAGSWVPNVAALEMVEPSRGGTQWELVRSLGSLPFEGIDTVLMRLQLFLVGASYK